MTRYVLDASAVLKWFLDDERGTIRARGVLEDLQRGEAEIHAPMLLALEVANGLFFAQKKGRAPEHLPLTAMESLLALGIKWIPEPTYVKEALCLAQETVLTVYDAAYLAVARRIENAVFMTGDRDLANVAAQHVSTEDVSV
jgi:predicted nucleic acid-binding protein